VIVMLSIAGVIPVLGLIVLGEVGSAFGWGSEQQPPWWPPLEAGVGAAFLTAGLVALSRRPKNQLGPLMIAIGFAWLLVRILLHLNSPVAVTLASWLSTLPLAMLIQLLFAFPTGRISSPFERRLCAAAYIVLIGGQLIGLLFTDPGQIGLPAGYNLLYLFRDRGPARVAELVIALVAVGLLMAVLSAFVGRWRRGSRPARRIYAPVGWSLAVVGVTIPPAIILSHEPSIAPTIGVAATAVLFIAIAMVPIGFLAGLLRSQFARAAVADLVIELGEAPPPGRLRDALARALGDPSVRLAYWLAEQRAYVDDAGRPVALPTECSHRAVALLQQDGMAIAAIIHDPALADEPGLVQAVSGATRMAIQNEQLQAALRARLAEISASRARIVEAADEERRRIERDLHDGTQQRLVSVSLALRLASSQLGPESYGEIHTTLTEAKKELAAALAELRELARGIHPSILTEEGLGPALESLAERATVPVRLKAVPGTRLPAPIEAAAYFVVSEALANVSKYSGATCATVSATLMQERLSVDVSDDGIGGADAARGSGLRGLADRLAALDGTILIQSPPGEGTTVHAEIPCAS
jgi:signal transduction histidine kinase